MDMDIDSPAESNSLPPRYRIVQRLSLQGVPEEHLERLEPGLVAYVKENKFRVPELVSAILPTEEEVLEAYKECKASSKEDLVSPTMTEQFRESMRLLQWLMFYGEPLSALNKLAKISTGQRGVCGSVWGHNDIAYRCRTCEHDPTCAICVPCFQNGNHKDHDYSVIYTGGGCCDCGDVTAWKREGFCSKHKGAEQIQPLPEEFAKSVGPVLDALLVCWKNKLLFAENACQEYHKGSDRIGEFKKVANELTFVVVEMLTEFCQYSESLLSFISKRVFISDGLLDSLVRAERFLSKRVTRKLHELLLKLLGEPVFKYEFAKVFLSYYPILVNEAIKGCSDSVFKNYPLLSTFSVQIFTVPTLTPRLVKEMNLLALLMGCLGDIFCSCAGEDGRLQVTKWGNLYETTLRVVEDIRFVTSHVAVPEYITHDQRDVPRTWMKLLAFVQGMNPQKRETGLHIEEENENMHYPFVLGHSIANIHSLLVAGAFSGSKSEETDIEILFNAQKQDLDDEESLRHSKVGRLSRETSVCGTKFNEAKSDCQLLIPASVTWLIFECLRSIENWLGVDNASGSLFNVLSPNTSSVCASNFLALKKTLSKIRKGKYIFSKFTSSNEAQGRQSLSLDKTAQPIGQDRISIMTGKTDSDNACYPAGFDDITMEGELDALRVLSLSDWPDILYDVSSQDISVHIPLHRLLSLLLQKALNRCYGEATEPYMISASAANPLPDVYSDFFGHVLGGCHPYGFSAFIMEHPLRIRVFCAEVHAGMWRRNGDAALLSCEWYRSVRWSEQGLELDLFLLQCCAALAPADLYVNRILDRFGLSEYLSLNLEQSSEYEPVLVQEMLTLIIQLVKERRFCGLTTTESLKRELIYKLAIGNATHSQLVKSLPRDLSKIDQLQEILDTIALYSEPSGVNQGMYSLRQAYWKELDLYHPRWNPRDLQFAEERYSRFCNVSALTTQLPKWTKIYQPLNGIARIATCKVVLQIVRAVLFYAVFTDKVAASRAPDGVLLTALHLLSLALDICFLQKEASNRSCHNEDSIPMLAFAGEEIFVGVHNRFGEHSLLSLLVLLMGKHKRENPDNFIEAINCNLSSWIESLLKKFAEMDSNCMAKLQKLAPEVVNHLLQSNPNGDTNALGSASDGEKRKAKARERQAAIMAKMRAEQSKFLKSLGSDMENGSSKLQSKQGVSDSVVGHYSAEFSQDVCSLCRDPYSESPVSYLILLQKSRLKSFVDKGPPSWEQVPLSDKDCVSNSKNEVTGKRRTNTTSCISERISSPQLVQLFQNAVNELASDGRSGEVDAFLEFIKTRFPSVGNLQLTCTSNDTGERTSYNFDTLEEDMYLCIQKEMCNLLTHSNLVTDEKFSAAEGGPKRGVNAGEVLLGKYIATLSRAAKENPSASGNAQSHNDRAMSESTTLVPAYDGLGPSDCDGIHLSSCGHAVHQGCLDRYLSSLKERYNRRMVFEGGHIVDPDQGEFLCPVCRQLANSVLPALPGDSQKGWKKLTISSAGSPDAAGSLTTLNDEINSLCIQQALSLLQSACNVVGKGEILKTIPMEGIGRIAPTIEPFLRMICRMYFPGKYDKVSGSTRVSQFIIMWDILKYSLISTEIASRCGRTSTTPTYCVDSLYKELNSSTGFILTLLLSIVQSMRNENPHHVLLRFRGIQLFAGSVCHGISVDEFPSTASTQGGNMLSILEHIETEVSYPDIQFWKRASDPVLAHDPFSSLIWVLFCLPYPFLLCKEVFFSLVHLYYAVSVVQAIITYCGKQQCKINGLGFQDCLITDISNIVGKSGFAPLYFVSSYIDPSCNIKDVIRSLSFPYLRRCALLWKLLNSSITAPFCDRPLVFDRPFNAIDDMMDCTNGALLDLIHVEQLENMFKIPQLDDVLKDEALRSLVQTWFHHFSKAFEVCSLPSVLYSTPAVPFKLMQLPHVYEDLLQRYIKQQCPDCKTVLNDPVLCLLCGRLCSPSWKPCCRENGCQAHAMTCGAGTGVSLLIKKTTILLQRSARQAPWPSLYLDAFGEEDIEMHRGKPLYLNKERYAALSHMVASHGLDRSSKVLGETTIAAFFLI
ncbi:E3 ubiquitin-protein ligase PRT6 isoform X1 [Vitis vinifera]|nr:E3 ubiquitin-protein ligase PRT6 isoform X1 [Vitis vinifera]XP_059595099.1 E3 ubiquitin-protein ligase PRT6 isoform X1 [Vitis vinifera]|eukprot:XP_010654283.1 PREDICTED: E3 ubiquitin-protein ligase PRT6 [Vitis vinifera]